MAVAGSFWTLLRRADLGRDDDARRDRVTVVVGAKFDAFQPARHRRTRVAVLHVLDLDDDVAVVVARDRDLRVVGTWTNWVPPRGRFF